jgi:hypothetical protein
VVRLGDMERDLGGQLLLEQRETLKDSEVTSGDINEEIVVIKGLELDLDAGCLHDFVDLAVLFPADEFAVLVSEFNLEADLVVERLSRPESVSE